MPEGEAIEDTAGEVSDLLSPLRVPLDDALTVRVGDIDAPVGSRNPEQPGRVSEVQRAVAGVGVGGTCDGLDGVAREESRSTRVVIAGAKVLIAGFLVGVLAGIPEGVRGGAR
jgi:hypothetical protein